MVRRQILWLSIPVLRTFRATFPCIPKSSLQGFESSHPSSPAPAQDISLRRQLFAPIPTPDTWLSDAETHRARCSLRSAEQLFAVLVGHPLPVVQAGERVPAGDGRGGPSSAARGRKGAQGQSSRQRGAAGRRLRQCGGHGHTEVPRPFPAEPHDLRRPLEARRVAGHRDSHCAAPRQLRSPARASRALQPRPDPALLTDWRLPRLRPGPAPPRQSMRARPCRPAQQIFPVAASGQARAAETLLVQRGPARPRQELFTSAPHPSGPGKGLTLL